MCWRKAFAVLPIALGLANMAGAGGFIIALGAEADSAGSSAYSISVDAGVGERTWISATAATSAAESEIANLRTAWFDLGIDHFFDPLGARVRAGAWGKDDFLESRDIRGSIYASGRVGSVSLDAEHRDLELTVDSDLLDRPRVVPFSANGIGLSARLELGERTSLHAGGMSYEYSRDIALQPRIDLLRYFTLTRLSLMNSLADYRVSGGIEWAFGDRRVDLLVARWQMAIDKGRIDSVGIGFLTPLTRGTDIEMRLSRDRSDTYGIATVLSVFLYLFND